MIRNQMTKSFNSADGYGKNKRKVFNADILTIIDRLGKENIELIFQKAIETALEGDVSAMKVVIDKVVPTRKGVRQKMDLPKIKNVKDLLQAQSNVTNLMSAGEISSAEALEISAVLEKNKNMYDLIEIAEAVKRLEDQAAKNDPTYRRTLAT